MSFAATLVDEWVRAGITDAVASPGSRSTPLTVALASHGDMRLHMVLDERSGSFLALGLALASGRPTVLTCTSGTAAAHYHAAVIEARQAGVPLIVCTADRPPELQDVGAPQTVPQVGLYGTAPLWSSSPSVADEANRHTWRSLAARAVCEATGPRPGPVHLNLMFREPLLDDANEALPPGRSEDRPWHQAVPQAPAQSHPWLQERLDRATRPIVIAGRGAPTGLDVTGVPVMGDHRSPYPLTVAHADAVLRSTDFVTAHAPDLLVLAGEPPASKVLATWVATCDVPCIVLAPPRGWVDPAHVAEAVLHGDVGATVRADEAFTTTWNAAGAAVRDALTTVLAGHETLSEPAVARGLLAAMPSASTLFVSSSMPVRDLEWFATPRPDVTVHANRGANGIDGIVSTATGIALAAAGPTALLTGDLALLHDTNGLLGLARRDVNLTIVVIDNGGGGIFSFLPQHEQLDPATFEALFTTPQHVDLAALAATYGLPPTMVHRADDLTRAVRDATARHGVDVIIATTDRPSNVAVHQELNAAALAALQ